MRRTLVAGTVAALALGTLPVGAMPQALRGECGVWRWDVKTLSDRDRTEVNFDRS
jgi:hypothetical protein